jgi:hypothetical protein
MPDSIFSFSSADQKEFNWLTRVTSRDGEYGLRFRYLGLFCPECHGFEQDKVFEHGFDPHIRIRVNPGRNIMQTDDDFLCVSEALLEHLKRASVRGFEHKQLPETNWHVLRITERVPIDSSILELSGHKCSLCKRQGQYGGLQYEREVQRPSAELTFFSSLKERGQGGYEIFATNRLQQLLKEVGAKGGVLHRLYTHEEEPLIYEKRKTHPTWHPKTSHVLL